MTFKSLKTTTIRDFSGGLNVVNDDLNMDKKYSTIETNVFYSNQGNKAKRFGTKFLKDIKSYDVITEDFKIAENNEYVYLGLYYNKGFYPQVGDEVFVEVEKSFFVGTSVTEILFYGNVKLINNDTIVFNKTTTSSIIGTIKNFCVNIQQRSVNNIDYFRISAKRNENKNYAAEEYDYIKPKDIVPGDTITIKSNPVSALVNKTYKVIKTSFTDDERVKQIFLDVSKDVTNLNENYTSDNYNDSIYSVNNEELVRNSAKMVIKDHYYSNWYVQNKITEYETVVEHFDNNSDLIVGHTVKYNDVEYTLKDIQTSYKEDENDKTYLAVYYYFNMKVTNEDKNRKIITVTHDNRNIKGDRIIGCEYFLDKIIAVSNLGEVVMIDAQQNASIIWNSNIAYTINEDKDISPWSEIESVCFAVFNGELTVWNGRDKPICIKLNDTTTYRPCNFLYDITTGSNANIPRAKYAIGFNHYLICANIINDDGTIEEDKISISMRDVGGTFYDFSGKDTPVNGNDAYQTNLGSIVTTNEQKITGLFRYRDKLVIGFRDVTILATLGIYEEQRDVIPTTNEDGTETEKEVVYNIHVPNFEDVITDTGCLSNKSYKSVGNEVICLDFTGVPSFQRTGLYSIVQPARISGLIRPEIYPKFVGLNENQIEDRIFSVHNPKENQYMLFIPTKFDENGNQTETTCYVYTLDNSYKLTSVGGSWSKFVGWNFQCGCTSALKEIFFFDKTKLYLLGNSDNPFYADFIDDPDYPDENGELSGKEIEFEWEFPWADFGDRSATKHSRYLAISSTGNSDFSIDFFTDYIYYNNYYKKLDPSLTLNFLAGDSHGWGNGKQSYGGGRITNNEQLFAWTTKFKIGKFRIHGASKYKLNINSITLYYQMGNIRR